MNIISNTNKILIEVKHPGKQSSYFPLSMTAPSFYYPNQKDKSLSSLGGMGLMCMCMRPRLG